MNDTLQLGPFQFGERIGAGGMGAVYRARHVGTDVDVALKVLPHGGDEAARRRFHREVQAQAELTHSGIVYLFEYGTVDPEVAARSDDLVAESPYVAMELAETGTLQDQRPLQDWRQLRDVLLQVLDALAFAHARDVIHRDLKPENVLVFKDAWSAGQSTMNVKLADFGLAHPFEDERERDLESLRSAAGTPFYMPPEQARGDWRAYGPWTDLYSIGCIAWELVCGHPPFASDNPLAVIVEHEEAERPPLEPQFRVPASLEAWIHRAMAPRPEARFRRAADAARALPPLSDSPPDAERASTDSKWPPANPDHELTNQALAPTITPVLPDTVPFDSKETPTSEPTRSNADVGEGNLGDDPTAERSTLRSIGTESPGPDSLPSTWRTDATGEAPPPLVGTGLGLFGLREVPFVDRNAHRDTLWESLRTVVENRESRVLLLAGEAGTGKSRLADWIATRAHEVGAAHLLKAVHAPGGGGRAEGLPGMVRRAFHTWQLSRGETYQRLCHELPLDVLRRDLRCSLWKLCSRL